MIKFFKVIDGILLVLCAFLIILSVITGGWVHYGIFATSLIYFFAFLIIKIMQMVYLVCIKKIRVSFFILMLCIISFSVIVGLGLMFNSENYIGQLSSILWESTVFMLILLILSFIIALFTQMFLSELEFDNTKKYVKS